MTRFISVFNKNCCSDYKILNRKSFSKRFDRFLTFRIDFEIPKCPIFDGSFVNLGDI